MTAKIELRLAEVRSRGDGLDLMEATRFVLANVGDEDVLATTQYHPTFLLMPGDEFSFDPTLRRV